MTDRATAWSVTINMKKVSKSTADECINQARAKGWKVEGQLEQGAEGTEHYQLLVRTPQTRFSAIKKMFPTAHIEAARNVDALREYVNKSDTRLGSLPTQNDKYPSITKMWEIMWDYILIKDWFMGGRQAIREAAEDIIPIGEKARLTYLDEQGATLIKQGYYIEQHIVNPQVRSSFAKFATELFIRTLTKLEQDADRQTDRQVEISSQIINIPVINEDQDEQSEDGQEQDTEQDGEGTSQDGTSQSSDDSSGEEDSGDESGDEVSR